MDYLYLVDSGVVKEQFEGGKFYRKTKGSMLNIANICSPNGQCLTTLTALSDCRLYKIRKRKLFNSLTHASDHRRCNEQELRAQIKGLPEVFLLLLSVFGGA